MYDQARSVCRGRMILIVDDRDSVRDVLRAILEDAGARVLEAATVKEAEAALLATSPDAVLTDLELTPQWRGGLAILELVRRHLPSCPVLLLTAWSDDPDRLHMLGFDAVLLKPTPPSDLVEAMASVIERRRAPKHGASAA